MAETKNELYDWLVNQCRHRCRAIAEEGYAR